MRNCGDCRASQCGGATLVRRSFQHVNGRAHSLLLQGSGVDKEDGGDAEALVGVQPSELSASPP